MTTELSLPTSNKAPALNLNQGAVEIESQRAIAEAQGQLVLAKRFPRDMAQAYNDLMEACKSKEFAESAFYSVPNRGSGPSIRLAEEVARCYQNFEYGHRELSRSEGKSEVEVYAWDKQLNNRSVRQIAIIHEIYTKNGIKKLTNPVDIDNLIANIASKQMRGRILALMPKHLVASAIEACKLTISGGNEKPLRDRITDLVTAFGRYGVTPKMLETYLDKKIDQLSSDDLIEFRGVFNALKDGAKVSDYFDTETEKKDKANAKLEETKAKVESKKQGEIAEKKPESAVKKSEPEPKSEPIPAPTPEPVSEPDDFDMPPMSDVEDDELF